MIKIESQQILIPKQVYIGDKAELRVTFKLNSALAEELSYLQIPAQLPLDFFERPVNHTEYEIQSLTLNKMSSEGQTNLVLSINFIPWKTGLIQFPEYNLSAALPFISSNSASAISENKQIIHQPKESDIALYFEPVEIVSLIKNTESASLKTSESPLLLPGTTYRIYAQLIAALLIIIVAIRLIVKHKAIKLFFKNQRLLKKYRKNRRNTEKQLKLLEEKNLTDKETAAQIQRIMRNYLTIRLEAPFTHAITTELTPLFYKTTLGLLPEEKENAFFEIVSVFIRTDFIRYSRNAEFNTEEKSTLIQKLLENINTIEYIEKNDKKNVNNEQEEQNA